MSHFTLRIDNVETRRTIDTPIAWGRVMLLRARKRGKWRKWVFEVGKLGVCVRAEALKRKTLRQGQSRRRWRKDSTCSNSPSGRLGAQWLSLGFTWKPVVNYDIEYFASWSRWHATPSTVLVTDQVSIDRSRERTSFPRDIDKIINTWKSNLVGLILNVRWYVNEPEICLKSPESQTDS